MTSSGEIFAALEAKLGHKFLNPDLCQAALTHKSWINENQAPDRSDNERLEFLGDAVLSLAVSDMLMRKHPQRPEGELSKLRASVVNELGLALVAEKLDLGQWIYLGRGEEQAGGRHKPSINADTLEALLGAVFCDAGFDASARVIQALFGSRVDTVDGEIDLDYKSRLQEIAQGQMKLTPEYVLVDQSGPDHNKIFEVALKLGPREYARATGRSKKSAQQAAAARALELLAAEARSAAETG